MKISKHMNLDELAERMGWGTEDVDMVSVETFRNLLVSEFDGEDTADIPRNIWLRLIDRSQQL